jgi:glycosyltransferase involved in cell wall biosynthesis
MRILIATDTFPPLCGGAGWSTYELARGLRARGHEIVLLQARARPRKFAQPAQFDGFHLRRILSHAPPVPFVRNYFNNELLFARVERQVRRIIREERIDVVHAQHERSAPGAIDAARREGVPVLCTVRDYWPVCYWSDLIHDRTSPTLCPACSPGMMTRCLRPHAGRAWPLAVPFIPYMTSNLARKRRALAAADVMIAVSGQIARDLRARAPELATTRIEVIPNPVSVDDIDRSVSDSLRPLDTPYMIYVGKLAPNKGVSQLVPAVARAGVKWPLMVVGNGNDQSSLEAAARQAGVEMRVTGWLPRPDVLSWMRHAELLVFPSHGPESLSRVLIEASALGVPIAAMDTGGTRDIISHGETGLLSQSGEGLAADVARLAADAELRARLGKAARAHVKQTFDAPLVAERTEAIYDELRRARAGRERSAVPALASGSE